MDFTESHALLLLVYVVRHTRRLARSRKNRWEKNFPLIATACEGSFLRDRTHSASILLPSSVDLKLDWPNNHINELYRHFCTAAASLLFFFLFNRTLFSSQSLLLFGYVKITNHCTLAVTRNLAQLSRFLPLHDLRSTIDGLCIETDQGYLLNFYSTE